MTAATTSVDLTGQPYKERSMRSMIWRHFRRHHMAMAGVIVLAIMIFGVITVSWLSPYDPEKSSMRERRTAAQYRTPMGTDTSGPRHAHTHSLRRTHILEYRPAGYGGRGQPLGRLSVRCPATTAARRTMC